MFIFVEKILESQACECNNNSKNKGEEILQWALEVMEQWSYEQIEHYCHTSLELNGYVKMRTCSQVQSFKV